MNWNCCMMPHLFSLFTRVSLLWLRFQEPYLVIALISNHQKHLLRPPTSRRCRRKLCSWGSSGSDFDTSPYSRAHIRTANSCKQRGREREKNSLFTYTFRYQFRVSGNLLRADFYQEKFCHFSGIPTYRKTQRRTAVIWVLVVAFDSTDVLMWAWQLGHCILTGSGPTGKERIN